MCDVEYHKSEMMTESNNTDIPKPDEPVSSGNIGDLLKFATEALQNPVVSNAIMSNPKQVKELIKTYAGNYESIIYGYLQSSHPDIYDALLQVPEPDNEEDRDRNKDTGMIPYKRFVDDVLDLHDEGYSLNQTADILSEKYNKRIYPMQVSRIIKKSEAEDDDDDTEHPEPDKTKPKTKSMDYIASQVAKWVAVSLICSIVGIVIGKVIL